MKKLILFILFPFLGISQIQIGQDIDGEAAGDWSGYNISLSDDGTILAIGSPNNDENGNDSGTVKVYKFNGNSWFQLGNDIDGLTIDEKSGTGLSLSGNGTILAIGSPYKFNSTGTVNVYEYIGNNWIQIGQEIHGENINNTFGWSVTLSSNGTIMAIGAKFNDTNGSNSGSVKTYQYNGTNWVQIGQEILGEMAGDVFGFNVSISDDGTVLSVGAPYNDANGNNSGSVKTYQYNGTDWLQIGQNINGEAVNDNSGWNISLSGNGMILAIGEIDNIDNGYSSGQVRIYKYNGVDWLKIGQDINGEFSYDYFGISVSLSYDGNILAVGAHLNDGNGTNSGSVTLFVYNNTYWVQVGSQIFGEDIGNEFGYSTSLSNNGNKIAIGARSNDGNGIDSGHVRVFDLTAVLFSDSFVQTNFKVYPNPVSEILTIELQNNLELQKVNFYNTLGQLIKTTKSNSTIVSDLSKGSYYVEVITNQGKATKTIIIE